MGFFLGSSYNGFECRCFSMIMADFLVSFKHFFMSFCCSLMLELRFGFRLILGLGFGLILGLGFGFGLY